MAQKVEKKRLGSTVNEPSAVHEEKGPEPVECERIAGGCSSAFDLLPVKLLDMIFNGRGMPAAVRFWICACVP